MATTYLWSVLTDGRSISFDPLRDRLLFDVQSISAASVKVSWTDSTSVTLS